MKYLVVFLCLLAALPSMAQESEVYQELKETVRAEVISIEREETRDIVGTDTDALVQTVRILVLEGLRKGEEAVFENDLMRLEPGDSIYVNRIETIEGTEYFFLKDADRRMPLIALAALFVAALLFFSGMQGFRALMSLALTITLIFAVLVPLLLSGASPVLVSILIAGPILASALFLTHGINARSLIAFFGTFAAVIVTGLLAFVWVDISRLTGLSDDAAIYLNFSTKGSLDFGGLLLGSIIIGILGVLDDVAITQASVVRELKRANPNLPMIELYRRGIRVGRDHVGSLVNTLALAYIGVALPLVLLLTSAGSDLTLSLNQEVVAAELIRIFLGSIGLILAVPFTTLTAAWWYEWHTDSADAAVHPHSH